MKVCVFSDSHGYAGNMIAAIELEKPELCFFLGDGERDADELIEAYPHIVFHVVRGNCDFVSLLAGSLICEVEGVRILATHGHLSNVKYENSLETLTSQALDAGAEVALFGHTHRQHLSYSRGVMLLNPGAAGRGCYPGYAVMTIKNGICTADLKTI